jgi:hypothetical protein
MRESTSSDRPTSPKEVSKSMMSTDAWNSAARVAARFVEIVVLPIPPFWPTTATTRPSKPFGTRSWAPKALAIAFAACSGRTGASSSTDAPTRIACWNTDVLAEEE